MQLPAVSKRRRENRSKVRSNRGHYTLMARKYRVVDELQVLSERFYFLLVSLDQDGGIFITRNSTLLDRAK